MKKCCIILLLYVIVAPLLAFGQTREAEKVIGGREGCFVLYNLADNTYTRINPQRCRERFTPCSTFKIPNSLIALQLGVHKDENSLLKWDGTPMPIKEWEKDHTLKSAIKASCVWYYQKTAEEIGERRMQQYLDRIGYGNCDMSGGLTRFWLQSSLKISPDEQVNFLARLYRNQLPFDKKATNTVKRLLVQKESRNFEFSGKTGSAYKDGKWYLGWFVGHVKKGNKEYVFATNIQGVDDCSGFKARDITIEILRQKGIWAE